MIVIALQNMAALFEVARTKVHLTLANETYQSYPIVLAPERPGGSPRVAFLYGVLRSIKGEGRTFFVPDLLAILDATSGDVKERRNVVPRDLGVSDDPGKVAGLHVLGKGMTADEYVARRKRLFELYDELAAAFLGNDDPSRFARDALEFRNLFFQVSEAPLAVYYRAVGRDFFGWIDRATRDR
jgi:hypothetical protein